MYTVQEHEILCRYLIPVSTKKRHYWWNPNIIHNNSKILLYFMQRMQKRAKAGLTLYKIRRRWWRSEHHLWPLIIRQLSVVFEPVHGGDERGVVFHLTLKHHRPAPLNHFVLWLLQDAGWLWWEGMEKKVRWSLNCITL